MKLKQTKVFLLILCLTVSSVFGLLSPGQSGTANAYSCPAGYTYIQNGNDSHNGQCQQIYYSTSDPSTPDPQTSSDGKSYFCSNGTSITNGKCGSGCSNPASTLRDGKCYTPDGTNDVYVPATTNDGKALDPTTNAECNQSNNGGDSTMKYVTIGDKTGCFAFSNGGTPGGCGVNVPLVDDGEDGGGVKCDDNANNVPYVPKDTNDDSDKTNCASGAKAPGSNTCKPYSDFTNADSCKAAGGTFKLTNSKDPANASDDVYTCLSPEQVQQQQQCGGAAVDPKTGKCPDGSDPNKTPNPAATTSPNYSLSQCGRVKTALISCDTSNDGTATINDLLRIIVSVLSALIGVAAVGGLAWASILYAKAEDNQSNVSEARTLIRNIVIGIMVYVFMVAITNFLVPGGILK